MAGMFGGKSEGWQCSFDPETQSHKCSRFESDKGQNFATGTTVFLKVNPQTCKASLSSDGVNTMMDNSDKELQELVRKFEAGCKGLA